MTSIILSPKTIFEQEFKTSMRGYDKKEVDEFLDDIIRDYETFNTTLKELREENDRLKKELANTSKTSSVTPSSFANSATHSLSENARVPQSATNFDILKRISRLEKEVFGKQIVE